MAGATPDGSSERVVVPIVRRAEGAPSVIFVVVESSIPRPSPAGCSRGTVPTKLDFCAVRISMKNRFTSSSSSSTTMAPDESVSSISAWIKRYQIQGSLYRREIGVIFRISRRFRARF